MEIHLLGTLLALLLIACVVALIAEWIKQPYTVALVLVGLGIAVFKFAPDFTLSKEVIFTLVLPPLLFQGALHMDLAHLKDNWKSICFLAIPGVIGSTVLIAWLVQAAWRIDFLSALVFGALMTPTDPLSVLSILRQVGAPERLRTILEGESLFNDGTGVVLFSVFLGMATGGESFDFSTTVIQFVFVTGGGIVLGAAAGYLAYRLLKNIENHLIEVTFTLVLAFGLPLLAEALHSSGIVAVVVAGLIIGNYGRFFSMSRKTRDTVENFWEVIDFIVNSLLFLAIGIELQVVHLKDLEQLWQPIAWGVFAVLMARLVIVYPAVFGINRLRREPIPLAWTHILFWGGLKGSIPIALVVGMPAGFEHRHLFLTVAFGIVLFSLVVQGLTIKPLVRRLGLQVSDLSSLPSLRDRGQK